MIESYIVKITETFVRGSEWCVRAEVTPGIEPHTSRSERLLSWLTHSLPTISAIEQAFNKELTFRIENRRLSTLPGRSWAIQV